MVHSRTGPSYVHENTVLVGVSLCRHVLKLHGHMMRGHLIIHKRLSLRSLISYNYAVVHILQ